MLVYLSEPKGQGKPMINCALQLGLNLNWSSSCFVDS